MEGKGGKLTSSIDNRDANQILIDQRKQFRTIVDTNQVYMSDPYTEALLDIYHALLLDIGRMKVFRPIPQEILAESLDELRELMKEMKKAGIILGPDSSNPFLDK